MRFGHKMELRETSIDIRYIATDFTLYCHDIPPHLQHQGSGFVQQYFVAVV